MRITIHLVGRILGLTAALGLWPLSVAAQSAPLTLNLDASTTLTTFIPFDVFGANTAYWAGKADNLAVRPLVEAAGNYFLRWPGGGQSDNYHWNGTGAFDASGHWVPDNTNYSPGFVSILKYRGTTSPFTNWVDKDWASHLVDGDPSTAWLSNTGTNFPTHQWVELDLTGKFAPGGATQVNAVTILWGTPSAASFQVQYWTGPNWPPPYQGSNESLWADTSAGISAGTGDGTTQNVTFNQVSTEYLRILLTSSTAGAAGAYSIRELYVAGPAGQVSRNNASQTNGMPDQTWVVASSTDNASTFYYSPDFNFEDYMAYCNSFTPHAAPLITTNLGTGSAQEAAAWVRYANVVKGYGIKYWQAGNEVNGRWETGGPVNAADHVKRFIRYYDAMKAVDPSIRVVGPVMAMNGDITSESSVLYDGRSFIDDYIRLTAAAGVSLHGNANYYFDGLDFHWYPFWGSFTAAQALNSAGQLDALASNIWGYLASAGVTGVANIPFIMSEYNSTADEQNFNVGLGNGLFVVEALGHFITAFGPKGHANYWAVLNGGSCGTVPTGGDPGYLNRFNDGYQYQPRAGYWAMKMMTHDWAIPADTRGHSLVLASTNGASTSLVTAYADYRPDGVLSLVVVNKDPVTVLNAVVKVGPFPANTQAAGWALDASNYSWVTTGSTPYHASPDNAPTSFSIMGSGGSFPVTFRPFSITVLQFTHSSQPTNTPLATPALTPTATPTRTPAVFGAAQPTLWPNPVKDGKGVTLSLTLGSSGDVRVRFFTTALRKIEDFTYSLPAGPVDLGLSLRDGRGKPISNGLYYVVVDVGGRRVDLKLLVLS